MKPKEQVITEFFESINSRHMEEMGRLLKSDAEFYFPKTRPLLGKDKILKFFNVLFRQYPQLIFQIHRIILQGNKAAIHWTNKGYTRKKEPYDNEGVTILEMEGGKIRFMSDFFKNTEKF
ncbi:MAG: nuclear transport factor 2 family protein [Deltaproteobacteria bacterium]|nr:nuclear transport factor 2 family protein [Deltaproteobacteria bacterium]MBW1959837.1 nuclear transport factor 2 family protein [Deltaproteobacteria bacterium]MBW1995776.1 nuclear transport factor 2 family protein [Deltaproteobacteria bacterium]MBW2153277.1 nuclear transport factor 2 family protein [Deltaproteobacteria bacterium]